MEGRAAYVLTGWDAWQASVCAGSSLHEARSEANIKINPSTQKLFSMAWVRVRNHPQVPDTLRIGGQSSLRHTIAVNTSLNTTYYCKCIHYSKQTVPLLCVVWYHQHTHIYIYAYFYACQVVFTVRA